MRSSISTPRHALSQWPWMAWNTLAVARSLPEPSARPFLWGASTEGAILLQTECTIGRIWEWALAAPAAGQRAPGSIATMPEAVRQLGRVPS